MIDAVTYGMMPSAKIDICSSAPPENMLKRPRKRARAAWVMMSFMTTRLTPGDGDEDADAVDGEHRQREQDPPPELRDLADVRERVPSLRPSLGSAAVSTAPADRSE